MADENEQQRVVPDDERARQILEQLKSVHAFDLAYESMVGLVNFGSQKMGLLEETREVRDLDDARLSIELVRAILEVVEREQGEERTRGLHDALAQMQLAYAHAVQLVNAERAAARAATEATTEGAAAGAEASPEPAAEEAAAVSSSEEAPAEPGLASPAAGDAPKKTAPKKTAPKKTAPKKPRAKKKPAARKKPAGES